MLSEFDEDVVCYEGEDYDVNKEYCENFYSELE